VVQCFAAISMANGRSATSTLPLRCRAVKARSTPLRRLPRSRTFRRFISSTHSLRLSSSGVFLVFRVDAHEHHVAHGTSSLHRLVERERAKSTAGRPFTTAGGKTAHARVKKVDQPDVTEIHSWGAHERAAVKQA
jgi:hypothetical protein